MIPIRIKTDNLVERGPLVAVELWVPRHVTTTRDSISTTAEISTAHAYTYIQEGIGTSLGLEPVGTVKITTATTAQYEACLFRIRVNFSDSNMVFEVTAIEVPYMLRPSGRVRCIIGRDILRFCLLHYHG